VSDRLAEIKRCFVGEYQIDDMTWLIAEIVQLRADLEHLQFAVDEATPESEIVDLRAKIERLLKELAEVTNERDRLLVWRGVRGE